MFTCGAIIVVGMLLWVSWAQDALKSVLTGVRHPVQAVADPLVQGSNSGVPAEGGHRFAVRAVALVDVFAAPGVAIMDLVRRVWAALCHAAAYLWYQGVASVKAMFAQT
jgi:hypothetical protein